MVDIRSRRVTRDKLARIFKDHELVKAFENLAEDVIETLPGMSTDALEIAGEALESALIAIGAARMAQGAADRLERLLGDVNAVLLTQPNERATIEALRNRVAQLEEVVAASQRAPDMSELQRQIDELRNLTIGS